MSRSDTLLELTHRAALAAIFVVSGISKLSNFEESVVALHASGIPLARLAILIAIVIELGAGTLVLLGVALRIAALVLIVYLLPVTTIFYILPTFDLVGCLKNVAIAGGLLGMWLYRKRMHARS